MPPKKNEALIEKFKRANEMKKSYSFNNVGSTVNIKEKIKKVVSNILSDYELKINAVVDLAENINQRLQEIENVLFDDSPDQKKD